MPAAKLNLSIEQGATWRHCLALKAGPGATAPALDLTGYLARLQLRSELSSVTVLLDLSSSNGRISITPLAGQLDLYISATDTAALDFDRAVYDLEIESTGGEVTRVLQGVITLNRQVTR